MFTGIVEEIAKVERATQGSGTLRLDVRSKFADTGVSIGDSVAINGACLTVVSKSRGALSFDAVRATLASTTLRAVKSGDAVHLERALKAGDALGGHVVTGHIDCVGKVRSVKKDQGGVLLEIAIPKSGTELLVEKGSIAVDGVSLTVASLKRESFTVNLIPHTLSVTVLGRKRTGDSVNIEFDQLGKYARKTQISANRQGITETFLREKGYI